MASPHGVKACEGTRLAIKPFPVTGSPRDLT